MAALLFDVGQMAVRRVDVEGGARKRLSCGGVEKVRWSGVKF